MIEEENKMQNSNNEKDPLQAEQKDVAQISTPHQTIIQPQKSKNKTDRLLFRPSMNSAQGDVNSQQPRPIIPVSSSLATPQKTKTPRGNSKNNNLLNTPIIPLVQTTRNQKPDKNSRNDDLDFDGAGSEDEDRDISPDDFDRKSMKELRRSVESTIQALMDQETESQTDPASADNQNVELDNDILSDHDDDNNNNDDNMNNDEVNNKNNNDNNKDLEKCGTSGHINNVLDQDNANEDQCYPDDFENSLRINGNENENDQKQINANVNDEDLNKEEIANEKPNQNEKEESQTTNQETEPTEKDPNLETNDGQKTDKGRVDLDKNFLITQVDEALEGKDNSTSNQKEETNEKFQTDGLNVADKDMVLVPKLELNLNENNEENDNDNNQNKPKKQLKQEPLFSEKDVELAFSEFQNNKTVPPPYMREATILYVHAITNEAIEDEDYDLAEKLDKDLKELITAFNKAYGINNANVSSQKGTSYTTSDGSSATLQSRLEEVKKQKIIAETEWEDRIKALKESEQSKIEEIEARQQKEREEFEEKCQTQEFLQKFTKPSARLLQLWKLQKGLALQHDFEGAKEMKARAEQLQKQETDEAQKRAISSVKVNYEKLVVKQQRELECAVANGKRKISQMEIEMKKDLENRDKLSKQVEIRMKEYRQPLKKSRLPPLNSTQIQSALNQIQVQSVNSSPNSNISSSASESTINSTASRDSTTSALSKRAVASRAKKKRSVNQVEQTTVLDVKIANIRSVLGEKTRNKK